MSPFRWGYTAGLCLIWLPFAAIGWIGSGFRWVADRIVDAIDYVND